MHSESNIDIDIKDLYLHDLELQYNAMKRKIKGNCYIIEYIKLCCILIIQYNFQSSYTTRITLLVKISLYKVFENVH